MKLNHITKAVGGLLLILSASQSGLAVPLTPQQALQRIEGADSRFRVSGNAPYHLVYTQTDDNQPRLYVFNRGNDGFVVTSADDRFPALLGYSDSGAFDPYNASPELMWWLSQYAGEQSFCLASPVAACTEEAAATTSRAPRAEIPQLLTTTWNQDKPYNLDCPTIGQNRCVTGCVATAMAQVVKYHAYPAQGQGQHSYEWNGQTLSFDYANTSFEYDLMLDNYGPSATAEQQKAVASLMYACGVGVNMSYTTNESGAADMYIPYALKDYFNYDKGIRLLKRNYFTDDEWEDLVYGELAEKRPVIYGGQAPSGGHQFVCDGYRDGYYHINWGWSGLGDGYFLLSALDPGIQGVGGFQGGYNSDQSMVWGAKPADGDGDGDVWYPIYATGAPSPGKVYDGNFAVLVQFLNGGFYNYSPEEFDLDFYMRFISESGEEFMEDRPMELHFNPASGLNVSGYNGVSLYIPTDLKEGRYKAYLEFKTPEGTWQKLLFPITLASYLNLTVGSDGSYTFTEGAPDEKTEIWVSKFAPASTVYSGVSTRFDISVENRGEVDFSDVLTVKVFEKGSVSDPLASNSIICAVTAGQIFNGYVDFTYNLTPGEYDIIVFDQYDEVASDVFPLTIERQDINVEEVTIDMQEATLTEGETIQLTATVTPEDATDKTLTWSSSDENVAAVADGLVTAIAPGQTSITVTAYNGKEASCVVTVNPKEPEIIHVESVSLDQTEIAAVPGSEIILVATVLPEDATDKTLVWTSSNETVATVDQTGKVTVMSEGSAIVTAASAENAEIKAECVVEAVSWVAALENGAVAADVYTVDGLIVKTNASAEYIRNLAKGAYIIRIGDATHKIAK